MSSSPREGLTLAGLRRRSAQLAEVSARRGASNLRVFGSVARGEATPSSDLDLLVDLQPGRSLFDLGGLLMDLSELLGVEVDVVTEAGLKPRVRDRVLAEAVAL
ncbi:MAG: nucleotidyltransferase family protein [Acidimicrobiia bacterium]|nr:nucleotidyltransferase family protein [Acidimicrobiia bacterium]